MHKFVFPRKLAMEMPGVAHRNFALPAPTVNLR